jgi:thiamine-phosphate pyrophosphorylase
MMLDPRSLAVYVVTSATLVPGRGHRDVTLAAVEGGATAIQLRAPELDDDSLLSLAAELVSLCRQAGVLFVVNNRLEVAVEAGADGVHLGQGDDTDGARARLGPGPALGVSVATREQARTAERIGADYLAVTVWPTETKPKAVALGPEGLARIAAASALPVVGIGGIDASNAARVLAHGAAGVAVVSAVAAADDPVEATRVLRAVVDGARSAREAADG